MQALDIEIVHEESGVAKTETWEIEVTEDIAKSLLATSGKSLSGMSPHDAEYKNRLTLEKYCDCMLRLAGLNFRKVRKIKESK